MSILPNISFKNTSIGISKMWNKILNLESTLFPALKEEFRVEELSHKEQKLIKILDFAQIEKNVTIVSITNTPKDREECARAFIAKSVYNIQTTRDLINSYNTLTSGFFIARCSINLSGEEQILN